MRDPREERGALALVLLQALLHLVEGARHGADLAGPFFGERRRVAALSELAGRARQLGERAIQRPGDEERGEDRDREPGHAPGEEGRRGIALDAPARKRHPVVALARGQPHHQQLGRQRLGLVGALGAAHVDVGLGAEEVADALAEHLQLVDLRGGAKALAAAHRRDADAFLLRDARDEFLLLRGRHRLQRGADRLQVAHELADAEGRARHGHLAVQQPERGRLREHERRHQHEQRAPQQRSRKKLHL